MNIKETHRIVLGTRDVMFLMEECKSNPKPEYKSILKRIVGVHARIINGVAIPHSVEKDTAMEKLGFEEKKDIVILREEAYVKSLIVPREQMGAEEIEMAEAHMYKHDLFKTSKELDDYETKHNLKFDSGNFDDSDDGSMPEPA